MCMYVSVYRGCLVGEAWQWCLVEDVGAGCRWKSGFGRLVVWLWFWRLDGCIVLLWFWGLVGCIVWPWWICAFWVLVACFVSWWCQSLEQNRYVKKVSVLWVEILVWSYELFYFYFFFLLFLCLFCLIRCSSTILVIDNPALCCMSVQSLARCMDSFSFEM